MVKLNIIGYKIKANTAATEFCEIVEIILIIQKQGNKI